MAIAALFAAAIVPAATAAATKQQQHEYVVAASATVEHCRVLPLSFFLSVASARPRLRADVLQGVFGEINVYLQSVYGNSAVVCKKSKKYLLKIFLYVKIIYG